MALEERSPSNHYRGEKEDCKEDSEKRICRLLVCVEHLVAGAEEHFVS